LTDGPSLDNLNILHTREDLVLDLESDLHSIRGVLFDDERLRFEGLELARFADIDDNIGTPLDLDFRVRNERFNELAAMHGTSSPRERITHVRGSLGSDMSFPEPSPRDSFHLRRDSSPWSLIRCS
jgi:hypothetical protein